MILGMDLSLTSTGICHLTPEGYETFILAPKLKGGDRLEWFYKNLNRTLERFPCEVACVEGYALGVTKSSAVFNIGELGGIARLLLKRRKIRTFIVPPSVLKKFVAGKGNVKKEQVLLAAYKKYGVEFATNDEADAFILAKIGEARYCGGTQNLTKYEAEALGGISEYF